MDIKRKRKEEYEIDPNSSFNKLRRLQMTLKEEVALTDIFFENRDDLLKKIASVSPRLPTLSIRSSSVPK